MMTEANREENNHFHTNFKKNLFPWFTSFHDKQDNAKSSFLDLHPPNYQ